MVELGVIEPGVVSLGVAALGIVKLGVLRVAEVGVAESGVGVLGDGDLGELGVGDLCLLEVVEVGPLKVMSRLSVAVVQSATVYERVPKRWNEMLDGDIPSIGLFATLNREGLGGGVGVDMGVGDVQVESGSILSSPILSRTSRERTWIQVSSASLFFVSLRCHLFSVPLLCPGVSVRQSSVRLSTKSYVSVQIAMHKIHPILLTVEERSKRKRLTWVAWWLNQFTLTIRRDTFAASVE